MVEDEDDFDLDYKALRELFWGTAEDDLRSIEDALVALEVAPASVEPLRTIMRGVHTLKGNSSSIKLTELAEFCHVVEEVLVRLRSRSFRITPPVLAWLLHSLDVFREMIAFERGVSGAATETLVMAEEEGIPANTTGSQAALNLRVETRKIDSMLTLLGEITIARARMDKCLEDRSPTGFNRVREVHGEAERLHIDLQELVMAVRMVPIGPLFRSFARVVRDAASFCEKRARLAIVGGEVEIDTAIVEQLRDPIMHMVRNAIDHGLESPEIRREKKKDPAGQILLRAFHDAGHLVVEISDDGAGFARQRIIDRALALGLDEPELWSDKKLYALVLEPGFTTARTTTQLSGRGIGMDVVAQNIRAMRGELTITTNEGVGTTMTVRLPLTVAIIDGFAVGAGGETYIIPLSSIDECFELSRGRVPDNETGGAVEWRGQSLRYLRLRKVFDLGGGAASSENLVVVRHAGGHLGLVVDVLFGIHRTVIKGLEHVFRSLSTIAGSTILGDGKIALILNIPTLFQEASAYTEQPTEERREPGKL